MRADIHDGPEQMLQSKAGYIDARPLTASSAKPLAPRGRTIHWVKLRRTQCEQMSSGLPLKADITQYSRHVSNVPEANSRFIRSPRRRGLRQMAGSSVLLLWPSSS